MTRMSRIHVVRHFCDTSAAFYVLAPFNLEQMESGFMAVGAAAVAYYVYSRTRRDLPGGIVETHRYVEQPPQNWTGELYLFAEALR